MGLLVYPSVIFNVYKYRTLSYNTILHLLYYNGSTDPINSHMRRHPKQYREYTIFSDIEII